MRDRGKKKDGQRNVLPPQIFNGDDYIGVRKKKEKVFYHPDLRAHLQQDFEDFDLANEDDMLEEFLGIERENPKVNFHLNNSPELTFPGGAVQNRCSGSRGGEKGGWEAAEGEDSGCEEGRSPGNSSPISLNISLSKTPK